VLSLVHMKESGWRYPHHRCSEGGAFSPSISRSSVGMGRQGETDRGIFMRMCSQIMKKKKLTG
jgi:hypothetical protein